LAFPVSAQGPDQIAYLGPGGSVWLADLESGETGQLAEAQGFTSLNWSPDGQRLLLVAGGPIDAGQGEVYVLEPESRDLIRAGEGYAPIWTSDSQRILYVSNYTFTEEGTEQSLSIYSLQDGSSQALVTQRWVSGLWPIERVAYSADDQFIAVYVAGLEMEGFIVIVDAEGNSVWDIPDMVYSAESFDWSPGNHELVYRDSGAPFMGGEDPSLRIVDVQSQETKQSFEQAGFWPRWSPDGGAIAALVWAEGSAFQVMRVDPGEAEPVLLADEVFGDLWNSELRWSPDGSLLVCTSAEEGRGQVHVMDRLGSLVTIAEGQDPELSWSPEGDRVAVAVGEGEPKELVIVGADGSGQRRVGDGWMPAWRPIVEGEPAAQPICALPTIGSVGAVVLALTILRAGGPFGGRSSQTERLAR
ncbi:MAG: hypothetical protein OEV76_11320, partial [Anaerolineae bacterium]|nr:hypothetical protein [Anaerolineae bacterium]